MRLVIILRPAEAHGIKMRDMQAYLQNPSVEPVVMPVLNEHGTLETVFHAVLNQPCVSEVITVDDHSKDYSFELLEELSKREARIQVLHHDRKQGKGAALQIGIGKASADIALIQDANFEYEPADYAALLKPILSGKADAVFGFRLIDSHEHKCCIFGNSLGNRLHALLSHMTTHLNLTDMKLCYKVFNRDLIQSVTIEENRFGIESSILTPKTDGKFF